MDLSAIALSGLEATGAAVEKAGRRVVAATSPDSSADEVDLSQAMVGLMTSQRQFEANLKAFQTADEMERHTIDVLG
jgi:flagellar hook protein FlgE